MSKIHGIATIKVNGQHFETEDDAELTPGGVKNTRRMVGRKSHYNQKFIGSKLECKIAFDANQSLTELQGLADVEIQFQSDTGQNFIIRSASQTGEVKLPGGESGGIVALVFEGDPAEEMI